MDLISLLNNTANGLSAIQAKAATTSNNIANANTPGYAQQQANLAEATSSALGGNRGYIGGGVFLLNVTQTRDQFVESQLPTGFSHSSSSTAESDALASVSTFNNGVDGNLSDAMSAFYSSLTALAQNPIRVLARLKLQSYFSRGGAGAQWNRCQRHQHRSASEFHSGASGAAQSAHFGD
jgi:flagellar hook-associated protein 1 FlgK